MKQKIKKPETELECFQWLEKKGLLHEEYDQYFSPHKAEHRHYSLCYAAAKKGKPQPPGGTLTGNLP